MTTTAALGIVGKLGLRVYLAPGDGKLLMGPRDAYDAVQTERPDLLALLRNRRDEVRALLERKPAPPPVPPPPTPAPASAVVEDVELRCDACETTYFVAEPDLLPETIGYCRYRDRCGRNGTPLCPVRAARLQGVKRG